MIWTPLDNSFCYIGSTFNRLHKRFEGHKHNYKSKYGTNSIHKYFDKYGVDNFKIDLIKSYEVVRTHDKDHKHLYVYETLWINKTKNCINKKIPFSPIWKLDKKIYYQTNKEKLKDYQKDYQKKYREENKDKIKETEKKYRQKNIDKIKDSHKKYYQNNKDKILDYYQKNKEKLKDYQKDYKEKNRDKILENNNEKFNCECGGKYTRCHKARHERSKKHINYLNRKNYYQNNKDKILDYYQKNKDKLIEQNKNYREKNRDKILEYNNEKFNCECGGKYTRCHKARHERSKKHINYINNLEKKNMKI